MYSLSRNQCIISRNKKISYFQVLTYTNVYLLVIFYFCLNLILKFKAAKTSSMLYVGLHNLRTSFVPMQPIMIRDVIANKKPQGCNSIVTYKSK